MNNSKVFIERSVENGHYCILEPVEKSIAECLANPAYQGVFYMRRLKQKEPILKSGEKAERAFNSPAFTHFATNHGLSYVYTGTTQMINVNSQSNHYGYRIIHLTDGPSYFVVKEHTNLIVAYSKIMGDGHYYRFDGTFKDVLQDMKAKGLRRVVRPEIGTLKLFDFEETLNHQRSRKITKEFIDELNRELYVLNGHNYDMLGSPEELREMFRGTHLF